MMKKIEALNSAISAVFAAGKEILEVYHTNIDVRQKDNNSPFTLADKRAHHAIIRHLKPLGIPILSEEGRDIPYDERKNWQQLWIVDPLDGTKEFIKRNDEYTVNIALIKNRRHHNSGRSQIAEIYLRKFYGDHFEIESAGLEPAEAVNPSTLFFCLFSEGICEGIVKGIGG